MSTEKALHFFDKEAISTVPLLEDNHEWEVFICLFFLYIYMAVDV